MSSTNSLAFGGPRDDAALTAAKSCSSSPGTTPIIRDSVDLQPCSFHDMNSMALSASGRSAVNSSTFAHSSRATRGGGGVLGNRISCLKTPPKPNLKRGGVGGRALRGFFAPRGFYPPEGHPGPPTPPPPPPPMKYIVFGTSEQLGMRPRCNLTIRTAPTNVYGRVSSAWVFPAVGTRNLGAVGLRGGHAVRNTPWG